MGRQRLIRAPTGAAEGEVRRGARTTCAMQDGTICPSTITSQIRQVPCMQLYLMGMPSCIAITLSFCPAIAFVSHIACCSNGLKAPSGFGPRHVSVWNLAFCLSPASFCSLRVSSFSKAAAKPSKNPITGARARAVGMLLACSIIAVAAGRINVASAGDIGRSVNLSTAWHTRRSEAHGVSELVHRGRMAWRAAGSGS